MKLSKFEKDFLRFLEERKKKLSETDGYFYFRRYIEDYLRNEDCSINIKPIDDDYSVSILINATDATVDTKSKKISGVDFRKINQIYSLIVQLVQFINELEQEKIITTFAIGPRTREGTLGIKTIAVTNSNGIKMDSEVSKPFLAMLDKSLIFSPEFNNFRKWPFKTKSEIKHLTARFLQFAGLLVAVSTGIFSIIKNF